MAAQARGPPEPVDGSDAELDDEYDVEEAQDLEATIQAEADVAAQARGPPEPVDGSDGSGHGSDPEARGYYAGVEPIPRETSCSLSDAVLDALQAAQAAHNAAAREAQQATADDHDSEAGDATHSELDALQPRLIGDSTRPQSRPNEVPMRVQPTLTKMSPSCAHPTKSFFSMENVRACMMLDMDPADGAWLENEWVTPANEGRDTHNEFVTPDDGSARILATKLCVVLASCQPDHATASESEHEHNLSMIQQMEAVDASSREDLDSDALTAAAHAIPDDRSHALRLATNDIEAVLLEGSDWLNVTINAHVPMMCLEPQTDDRALGPQANSDGHAMPGGFAVNEEKVLTCGRDRWRLADPQQRVLNTELRFVRHAPPTDRTRGRVLRQVICKFIDGRPMVELEAYGVDRSRMSFEPPAQLFAELMDLSQYSERELAEVRPAKYVPLTTLLQLAAFAGVGGCGGDDLKLAALITHAGPKIRYDGGKWWNWKSGVGWRNGASNTEAIIAVRAAATDIERQVSDLADRSDFKVLYHMATGKFQTDTGETPSAPGAQTVSTMEIKKRATQWKLLPSSERGLASLMAQLLPWVSERGFANSFERCKDIAFTNGVQQMRAPFAFRTETPDDHVLVRIPCDLPQAPTSEEQKIALCEIALEPLLDLFQDKDVALREGDKIACLLSGTCAVMPEANFRPMVGQYDTVSGRYATRCGKNTLLELLKTLLGAAIDDSLKASFLSMVMEPGRSYSELRTIETRLGHWIDEAEAQQVGAAGGGQLRPWGSLPKKIWAGGGATAFAYRCEYHESTTHELRTNALMISSNEFNIGSAPDIWSKLEPTPFPRVADIPENQGLIESGVPYFELDPSKGEAIKAMDSATRGKHLRYLMDRAIAIYKDPKAAYPITEAHAKAKAKLKEVAGGTRNATAMMSEADAFDELREHAGNWLAPCLPKGASMESYAGDCVLARKNFQCKNPRCFCGKKTAAQACSFTVSEFAEKFKVDAPLVYGFYVQKADRLSKLTSALQRVLNLPETPISRVFGKPRDAIFGWTLGCKEAEVDAAPPCSSAAVPQSDDETGLLKPTPGYKHTVSATGFNDLSAAKPPVAKKPVVKPVAKKPVVKKPACKPPRKKQKHDSNEDDDDSESDGSGDEAASVRGLSHGDSHEDGNDSEDESANDSNKEKQSDDEASMSGGEGSDDGSESSDSADGDLDVKANSQASEGSDSD